ncbi:proteasome-interacting protein Cic1p [Diutina catenulata]
MPPKRTTRASKAAAEKVTKEAAPKKAAPKKAVAKKGKATKGKAQPADDTSSGISKQKAIKAIDEIAKFVTRAAEEAAAASSKSQLFEDDTEDIQNTVFLQLNKKKYFSDKPEFKPRTISLTNRIVPEDARVCLIVRDGAVDRADDLEALTGVTQIVPVKALKTDYKNFEKRRAFHRDYDVFLVDTAVLNIMPTTLGKIFYKTGKYPVPVDFQKKEFEVADVQSEVDRVLASTWYMPPMGTVAQVKLGQLALGSEALAQNLIEVAATLNLDDFRSVAVKSRASPALSLYLADKLYTDDDIENGDSAASKDDEAVFEKALLALGTEDDVAKALGKKLKEKKDDDKKKTTKTVADGKVAKN